IRHDLIVSRVLTVLLHRRLRRPLNVLLSRGLRWGLNRRQLLLRSLHWGLGRGLHGRLSGSLRWPLSRCLLRRCLVLASCNQRASQHHNGASNGHHDTAHSFVSLKKNCEASPAPQSYPRPPGFASGRTARNREIQRLIASQLPSLGKSAAKTGLLGERWGTANRK